MAKSRKIRHCRRVKRRRNTVRLAGLVVGLLAFLRAPFDVAPLPSPRWWEPPPPPRASASATPERPTLCVEEPRHAPTQPPIFAPAPYRYYGPANAHMHSVSADPTSLGSLVEERLALLEGFGDVTAGRDILFLLGAEQQSVGDFGRAAEFYEAFLAHPRAEQCDEIADATSPCAVAAQSLENAIVFRRALGNTASALNDADLFEARFAEAHPRAATRVAFAAAEIDSETRLLRLERLQRRRLPPAESVQVEVRLGLTLWDVRRTRARRHFRRAERLWRRHGGAQMAASHGLDATAWIAELGRTREALAESRFVEARRRFRVARAMTPPSYEGVAQETVVRRWVERRLQPWMQRRMRAMDRAKRGLDRVDALGLSRWSVPSAALRGELDHDLADALGRLALPDAVAPEHDESITEVAQHREPVHRHLVQPAISSFHACMHLASETGHYGAWSDRCADALARYEPRYRRPPELHSRRAHVVGELPRP